MGKHEQLISQFYNCFKNKDFKGMQECYADDAIFNDPVFVNLNSDEVKSMWEMLIKNGKGMELSFDNIQESENTVTAKWQARYTFSLTGRKVTNDVNATFTFKDGKIQSHTDRFNFYKWSAQAFGTTGLLLGWTSFFKNKIRKTASGNLKRFMGTN